MALKAKTKPKAKAKTKATKATFAGYSYHGYYPRRYRYRPRMGAYGAGKYPHVVTRYLEAPMQIPPTQMQQITEAIKERRQAVDEVNRTAQAAAGTVAETRRALAEGGAIVYLGARGVDAVRRWWDPAGATKRDARTEGASMVNQQVGFAEGVYDATKEALKDVGGKLLNDAKQAKDYMFPAKNVDEGGGATNTTQTNPGVKREPLPDTIWLERPVLPTTAAPAAPAFHEQLFGPSNTTQVPPHLSRPQTTSQDLTNVTLQDVQNISFSTDVTAKPNPALNLTSMQQGGRGARYTKKGHRSNYVPPPETPGLPLRAMQLAYGNSNTTFL